MRYGPAAIRRSLGVRMLRRRTGERAARSPQAFIAGLLDDPSAEGPARAFVEELSRDVAFAAALDECSMAHRGRSAVVAGWSCVHYALTRILRPDVVVETGVFDGLSSACWLLALARNDHGRLVSVDLPAAAAIPDSIHTSLPAGLEPGWIIPDHLRDRHQLLLGDARDLLPPVLDAHKGGVDIFFHDSLHTEAHMLFEFRAAFDALKPGGLVLSDDYLAYDAFASFARGLGREGFLSFDGLAGLKK